MKVNLGGARNAVLTMTRYNDVFLAILVVAIISLIVLPMPTPLVDGLIATNLGLAVTLIMLAMYIPSALSLSTFPSILLFTTLFRLALNITTTRLILLNADAGEIINTFGNFVVAGNFIVGGVIFLVITIVQFLVIAKGSERVAEVAARFTLDAMPGKQMSIDADLRAGVIDMDEAKRRRGNVEKESQLYGAMDGAMKFVKGDAVAGIIITAINILGGIAVGVLQKGMEIDRAVQTFSILTIGDGLVSQIPALFISITAGIYRDPGDLGGAGAPGGRDRGPGPPPAQGAPPGGRGDPGLLPGSGLSQDAVRRSRDARGGRGVPDPAGCAGGGGGKGADSRHGAGGGETGAREGRRG